jgi:hypothetical protein
VAIIQIKIARHGHIDERTTREFLNIQFIGFVANQMYYVHSDQILTESNIKFVVIDFIIKDKRGFCGSLASLT